MSITVTLDFDIGDQVKVIKPDSPHKGIEGVIRDVRIIKAKDGTKETFYNLGIYMEDVRSYMYYTSKSLELIRTN